MRGEQTEVLVSAVVVSIEDPEAADRVTVATEVVVMFAYQYVALHLLWFKQSEPRAQHWTPHVEFTMQYCSLLQQTFESTSEPGPVSMS